MTSLLMIGFSKFWSKVVGPPTAITYLDSKQCKIVAQNGRVGHVRCKDGRQFAVWLGQQTSHMHTGELLPWDPDFARLVYDNGDGGPEWTCGMAGKPPPPGIKDY